ncbi:MAG TPA: hypothetical protein VJ770_21920 [Stellaceae bacterium]|nr:hypothetical protein [Stellaceae bacterium]
MLFLLLAGCGSAGLPPLPADHVEASFPPHGLADAIVVDALARLPLRRAELVAPDGKATPSGPIDVNPTPSRTSYQAVASHPYGGSLAGIGPREDLLQLPSGAAPQTESRLLEMHSTATIAVPDPVAYRRAWRTYRIRLLLGTPPAPLDSETIPAPAPPSPVSPSPPLAGGEGRVRGP